MEDVLLTGVAGFIGSHLAQTLLREGYRVIGVDNFSPNYQRSIKEANLSGLIGNKHFVFYQLDLAKDALPREVLSASRVFHLAARPGVRASWGGAFADYTENNVLATQRLLEQIKESSVGTFVFASSSSIYGNCRAVASGEADTPDPISLYGVSKLAGEHVCRIYSDNYGVPVVILRYFTVYGERQRPDMAFHIFFRSLLRGEEITVYGDGTQMREFTYVDDVVDASVLAMRKAESGEIFNVGGGVSASINEVIETMQRICGRKAIVRFEGKVKGDVNQTSANIDKARSRLGYEPAYSLDEGLKRQYGWIKAVVV